MVLGRNHTVNQAPLAALALGCSAKLPLCSTALAALFKRYLVMALISIVVF